jgi:glutathione S-transferase
MTKPHAGLMQDNPLSKIPTLVLDDGTVVYDSPVICEYFDSLHAGPRLFPTSMPERIVALRRQALGDGFLDLLILNRDERARVQPSGAHLASMAARKQAVLATLDNEAGALEASAFGIGHVAVGCALSYLDFRFADEDWRKDHPRIARWHAAFAARSSVRATEPVDDS